MQAVTRPTVLICVGELGDDRPALEAIVHALSADGRVIVAETPDLALTVVAGEDLDCVICETQIGRMSAFELLTKAREMAPALPAVLLAAPAHVAQAAAELTQALAAGQIYGYVEKPWPIEALRTAVTQAIAGRQARRELDQQVQSLSRRLDAAAILHEFAAGAGELTTHQEILDLVTATLSRIVRYDVAATLITTGNEEALVHLHCQTPCDDGTLTMTRDRTIELCATLTGRELSEDQIIVRVTGERLREVQPPRGSSSTHIPLTLPGGVRVVGVIYLVAFRVRAFTAEDEKLLYMLATQTSEAIRRLSTRIMDERRKMALMVESMADGVIMTDEKSEIFLINPSARRSLGLGRDVPVTAKFLKEKLGFYPFDLVSRARPAREEVTIGDKTLHSIVSPVLDGAGKLMGVVVVLRDITEWKDLEQRKEEFVSIVSHELRTPLTSIGGALDIVLKEYAGGLSEKQRRYLQIARESCTKLHMIVNDLLDVARFEEGKMPMQFHPLALDRLAMECVERFRASAESKQVSVTFKLDREGARPEIRIVGDADRLSQVLHNLLSNAIKFTPEAGRIEVEVFGPGVASSHVGVSVWNNGEPIPEEDRERVFDKFEQVNASATRRVGGTGLGLAISRSIVEGHGGKIWVESAPIGTKFVLTLPAAPVEIVPAHGQAHAHGQLPDPSGAESAEDGPSGRKVLVVDDDRYAAYLLKGVLMAAGHKVHVAHDADEALTWARDKKPDLVTVDVRMPGVDGLALVEILKHDPDTRKAAVVVVSAITDREAAILAGADAYFGKPVDVDAFRDSCNRLLAEKTREASTKILVVDDDPGIRMICREVLEAQGYVVREATDGQTALIEAKRFRPDLMLLDVMMPDLDGFQTAKRFRSDRDSQMTPVIFVSARGQTADKVRAFKLGAEDYLVKPFDSMELVARVEKALDRRDRELGASPTTKLPGAGAIEAEIDRRLHDGGDFAFCYVDLDNLKAFNDYYGIAKADGVIRQTGDLMREVVAREGSQGDFIGHIAGDDFVFITTPDRVDRIARTICQTFDRLVPLYYNKADRERGYIETCDRYGQLRKFPIMSVSIAALTTTREVARTFTTYAELARVAADAKKQAKSVDGSSFVRDGQVVLPVLAQSVA